MIDTAKWLEAPYRVRLACDDCSRLAVCTGEEGLMASTPIQEHLCLSGARMKALAQQHLLGFIHVFQDVRNAFSNVAAFQEAQ